jgi:streptogramin lyase
MDRQLGEAAPDRIGRRIIAGLAAALVMVLSLSGFATATPLGKVTGPPTTDPLPPPPEIETKLANPASPTSDDPLALSQLGSPGTPENDLAQALQDLAGAGTTDAVATARKLALDILEGNPLAGKAYSGLPLLNWNAPQKIKPVPPGGNVDVREVRYGQHILTDTWLLDVADPAQPFTVTYHVAELGNAFGGDFSPTALTNVGGDPAVSNVLDLRPLALPPIDTGTTEASRFHPAGGAESTRTAVQKVTVSLPAPHSVTALLDPNLTPGHEALATIQIGGAGRAAAATAALGTSKLAGIGAIGSQAPEKLLWSDLENLDPTNLNAAKQVAAQDAQLVTSMRVRDQLPSGVTVDPTADLGVALLNDEAYVSRATVNVLQGHQMRVALTNGDAFARTVNLNAFFNRKPTHGALDWGQFDYQSVGTTTLAPGESKTVAVDLPSNAFTLWVGDTDHGDQASAAVALDLGPDRQSLRIPPGFAAPGHSAIDGSGNVWLALGGTDEIARIDPADDLSASRVERFELPDGAHTLQSTNSPLVPKDVAFDAHGILWVTLFSGNAIARVDPTQVHNGTSDGITIVKLAACNVGVACPPPLAPRLPPPPPGTPPSRAPGQMAVTQDAQGNTVVWFAEEDADAIGVLRATPAGQVIDLTDLPCQCAQPLGMALNADGSIWFTEGLSNRLGKLTPDPTHPFRAGTLDHFPIPSSVEMDVPGGPKGGFTTSGPHSIGFDQAGRAWFTEEATGKVGWFDPVSGFSEMNLPETDFHAQPQPADLSIDRNGTVFVVDEYGDSVVALDVTGVKEQWRPTQRISQTDKPVIDAQGNLWFAEGAANRLTRFRHVAAGPAFVPAVRPLLQADVTAGTVRGSNLGTASAATITVGRATPVTVPVASGGFVVTGAALHPGDVIRVALKDTVLRPALVMTVADVSAAVAPSGALAGSALLTGRALADQVSVAVAGQAAPSTAAIDPVDGTFSLGGLKLDPAVTKGTVSWTGATPVAMVSTVAAFAPDPVVPPAVVPAVPVVTPVPAVPAGTPAATPSPDPAPAPADPTFAAGGDRGLLAPKVDNPLSVSVPPPASAAPAAGAKPGASKASSGRAAPSVAPASAGPSSSPLAEPGTTRVADARVIPAPGPTPAAARSLDLAARPVHQTSPLFGLGMSAGFFLVAVLGLGLVLVTGRRHKDPLGRTDW